MTRILTLLTAVLIAAALSGPAVAQNPYSAAFKVNNSAVTYYELEQRASFLKFLRVSGNHAKQAEEGLIDDRLRLQAAADAGLSITPEELEIALEEFAQRGNLTTEEFIKALDAEGISPDTFYDFVEAQVLWRAVVQGRFGPQSRPTDQELERALAISGQTASARVRLAEIVLPAGQGEVDNATALANDLKRQINSVASFTNAARRFSVAPSRRNGGLRDWVNLSTLPPALAAELLVLGPGEVSEPFPFGNEAIALFQVRSLVEGAPVRPRIASIDYATVVLPGIGDAAVAEGLRLKESIDVCGDLWPYAQKLPPEAFRRETEALGKIPADIRRELEKLDSNEASLDLTRGQARIFVMLCSRTRELADDDLQVLQQQLFGERISSYASGYIAELRADARIERQ